MNLKDQLLTDYKTAMKEHDVTAKETINLVRAAIKQYEIDKKVVLEDDENIFPIIRKQLKMRKDALADFEKAGRTDLLDSYHQEIEILEKYMPEEMSENEIRSVVEKIAEKSGTERNMKSMGNLMKLSMAELSGRAEGSAVSRIVKEYLSK